MRSFLFEQTAADYLIMKSTAALISSSEQVMHMPLGGMALKPEIACL